MKEDSVKEILASIAKLKPNDRLKLIAKLEPEGIISEDDFFRIAVNTILARLDELKPENVISEGEDEEMAYDWVVRMSFGGKVKREYEPSFVLKLHPTAVGLCKLIAKLKVKAEGWKRGKGEEEKRAIDFWGACYTSEFAFNHYLKVKERKHIWAGFFFGEAGLAPPNFTLWKRGEKFTAGIRSRRHKDWVTAGKYGYDPVVFYPVREYKDMADYIIASSLMTNDDGSSSIGYWGAITKDELQKVMEPLSISRYLYNPFKKPPLKCFNKMEGLKLLQELVDSLDLYSPKAR